ncbi:MAG: DUF6445 family protein [Pseudomonadota bacterium]
MNRAARLAVRPVGRERTPLICIDNFAVDTQGLVAAARDNAAYGPDPTSRYPGVRARLPEAYVRAVVGSLLRLLFEVYKVPTSFGLKIVNAVYSLITTAEANLEPPQRNPHFDSVRPHYLAILHYLGEGPFCDTGLFRHRETGFESLSAARMDSYAEARARYEAAHGEPPCAYIKDSNDQYELYDRIEYRPNRLVVYPGAVLHSGLVDPDIDISADPVHGRLTANLFVDFVEAGAKRHE